MPTGLPGLPAILLLQFDLTLLKWLRHAHHVVGYAFRLLFVTVVVLSQYWVGLE
jgi:hypothetical protein